MINKSNQFFLINIIFCLLLVLIFYGNPSKTYADQTEWIFPTQVSSSGYSNGNNVLTRDGNLATCTACVGLINVGEFNKINIPDTAAIEKVEIRHHMSGPHTTNRFQNSLRSSVCFLSPGYTKDFVPSTFNDYIIQYTNSECNGWLSNNKAAINNGQYRVEILRYVLNGNFTIDDFSVRFTYTIPTPTPTSTPTPSPTPSTSPTPVPFLDLPWDYQTKGKSFNDAAMAINSYFDHEFPLQSRGKDFPEPASLSGTLVPFSGISRKEGKLGICFKFCYSGHDGYDYGSLNAGVNNDDPVYPAASGSAEYKYSSASGNMIYIDHHNHYQTRYYHLRDKGIFEKKPNEKINVDRNTIIGYVGSTGLFSNGPHIHFAVFEDKDKDGGFADEEPFGVTDPFGWEPENDLQPNLKDPDPWENYTFNQNGINKTGNKSNYLWLTKINMTAMPIPINGGEIIIGPNKFLFPQGIHATNFNVQLNSTPYTKTEINGVKYKSILPSLKAEARDLMGNLIETFLSAFTLTINFTETAAYNIKPDTLSVYSSQDMTTWTLENTKVDFENNIATTSAKHFTYLALMGEIDDTTPPVTNIIFDQIKGADNWFKSEVTITLNATDDKLGVDYTYYKKQNEDWKKYSAPLTFTEAGNYEIQYYSVDKDRNIEDVKTTTFKIDLTPPEAEILYDLATFDSQVNGKDNMGVATVSINKTSPLHPKYTITDQAGNTLILNTDKIKLGKQVALSINSLQYNTNPAKILDKNVFFTLVLTNKKNIPQRIDQYYSLKNDKKIFTNYSSSSNLTKIYTKNPGSTTYTREDKPGITLLQLTTENGKLKYGY